MQRQHGFTYLGLLVAIALLGIGLSVASEVWVKISDRQRRMQMEWIGEQYRNAIASFYYTGSIRTYPKTLDDLTLDKRFPRQQHHLRELYSNPYSSDSPWKTVPAPGGGIRGVFAEITEEQRTKKYEFDFIPETSIK